jgi:3-hydroxyisobutyrate dehydrogenase-like beta-hydroxyacid dehydrogenase
LTDKVGVIGVGSMGGAIVERLLSLGYTVTVWDIDRSKVVRCMESGAWAAESAAHLVASNEIVLASLPSPRSVLETFLSGELVARLRPGLITIDLSTVDPTTSRRVYTRFREAGAHYLDAPVSGGPRRAAAGKLTITVGGDEDAFRRCEGLLRQLGERVFYIGGSGGGSTLKLINQLLVFAHAYAAMEALTLSESLGVEPAKMYEVVKAGSGNSFMFEEMVKLILSGQVWGGRTELLIKDIRLTHEMAERAGVKLRLCGFLREMAERMAAMGFGGDDAVRDFLSYVQHASRLEE